MVREDYTEFRQRVQTEADHLVDSASIRNEGYGIAALLLAYSNANRVVTLSDDLEKIALFEFVTIELAARLEKALAFIVSARV